MSPWLVGLGLALMLAACSSEPSPTPSIACPTSPPTAIDAQATLEDAAVATVTVSGAVSGDFVMELYGKAAPIATANFVTLSRCGFYDGVKFHRVLAGFVAQAGDPGTKTNDGDFPGLGAGGEGYEYEIEAPDPDLGYDSYSVSVANDTRTNDSQFFIALTDLNNGLARSYTIFGQLVSGTDVIDQIARVPVNNPRDGVPLTPVTIDHIAISAEATPSPSE